MASSSHRTRVLIVYGGRSSEHEVSIRSATEVLAAIDRDRFEPSLLAIAPDGRLRQGSASSLLAEIVSGGEPVRDLVTTLQEADIVFPILHGPFGEDGTFQGLLEVLDVAYVGSGVLASALCMDKAAFKSFVGAPAIGLPVTPGVNLEFLGPERSAQLDQACTQVRDRVGFPCFVKPANQGSSVGVSKVNDESELRPALSLAADYDPRVVVEKSITDAREIELAVLGNGGPETRASGAGEIGLPPGTWYDYEAKYEKEVATLSIPAQLDPDRVRELQSLALKAFRAVGCKGLARVDFLVDRETGEAYLNEVNTMPGFTSISMYPKLMEEAGVPYSELIAQLCALGEEHHSGRKALRSER
jgi:D-alanine-D-alanine ligase